MKNLLWISIFIMLLSSCKKEKQYDTGKIVFEYEYINYAWGYQHNGWFIDTNGVVRLHKSSDEHESWKWTDSDGYISESDLQHNYDLSDTVIYNLDAAEVKANATLIGGVTEDDLSDKTHLMADAGEGILYCYAWDESARKYKRFFLAESGDITQTNKNANAVVLTSWLINKGKNQIKYLFFLF